MGSSLKNILASRTRRLVKNSDVTAYKRQVSLIVYYYYWYILLERYYLMDRRCYCNESTIVGHTGIYKRAAQGTYSVTIVLLLLCSRAVFLSIIILA